MDLGLKGKNALVCGSSSGIGEASAIMLAGLGANITLLARNADSLKKTLAKLDTSMGQNHAFIIADTAQHDDLAQKIEDLVAKNPIHILINNSGGPPAGPIVDAELDAFRRAFDQHLLAYQLIVQLVVPGMKEAGYGRIINVISTSVKVPLNGLGVSNTVRAAVANWSKTLATELGPSQITVNNVLPGATETERLTSIISNKATKQGKSEEAVKDAMLAQIPMKRFGKSKEIASAVAFLASPAAAYITGTQITVDGGRTGVL